MITKISPKKESFSEAEVEQVQFVMAKIFSSITPQPVTQAIIPLGNSQSGISTLMNFLIKTQLKGKKVSFSRVVEKNDPSVNPEFEINHGFKSKNFHPKQKIIDKVQYFDIAGFVECSTTQALIPNIVNSFSLQHILSLPIPKVLLICIPMNYFEYLRGSKIIQFLRKLVIGIGPNIVENNTCVVFTKARQGISISEIKESLKILLQQTVQLSEKSQIDLNTRNGIISILQKWISNDGRVAKFSQPNQKMELDLNDHKVITQSIRSTNPTDQPIVFKPFEFLHKESQNLLKKLFEKEILSLNEQKNLILQSQKQALATNSLIEKESNLLYILDLAKLLDKIKIQLPKIIENNRKKQGYFFLLVKSQIKDCTSLEKQFENFRSNANKLIQFIESKINHHSQNLKKIIIMPKHFKEKELSFLFEQSQNKSIEWILNLSLMQQVKHFAKVNEIEVRLPEAFSNFHIISSKDFVFYKRISIISPLVKERTHISLVGCLGVEVFQVQATDVSMHFAYGFAKIDKFYLSSATKSPSEKRLMISSGKNHELEVNSLDAHMTEVTALLLGPTLINELFTPGALSLYIGNNFTGKRVVSINEARLPSVMLCAKECKVQIDQIIGMYNMIALQSQKVKIMSLFLIPLQKHTTVLTLGLKGNPQNDWISLRDLYCIDIHKFNYDANKNITIVKQPKHEYLQKSIITLNNVQISGNIMANLSGEIFFSGKIEGPNHSFCESSISLQSKRSITVNQVDSSNQNRIAIVSGGNINTYGSKFQFSTSKYSSVDLRANSQIYIQNLQIQRLKQISLNSISQQINFSTIKSQIIQGLGTFKTIGSQFLGQQISISGGLYTYLEGAQLKADNIHIQAEEKIYSQQLKLTLGVELTRLVARNNIHLESKDVIELKNTILQAGNSGKIQTGKLIGLVQNQSQLQALYTLKALGLKDEAMNKILNLTLNEGTVPDFLDLTDITLTKQEVNYKYAYLSRNVSLQQSKGDFIMESSVDFRKYDSVKLKTDKGKFHMKGIMSKFLGKDVKIEVSADIIWQGAECRVSDLSMKSQKGKISILPIAQSFSYRLSSDTHVSQTVQHKPIIACEGTLSLDSAGILQLISTSIEAENMLVKAAQVTVGYRTNKYHEVMHREYHGFFRSSVHHREIYRETVVPTTITLAGTLEMKVDGDTTFTAAQVIAEKIILDAKGDITIKNGFNVYIYDEYQKSSSLFSVFSDGWILGFGTRKGELKGQSNKSVVPSIFMANNTFYGCSKGKIYILGSIVDSKTEDIHLVAPKGVKLEAVAETGSSYHKTYKSGFGLRGGLSLKGGFISVGYCGNSQEIRQKIKVYTSACLNSLEGKTLIKADDGAFEMISSMINAKMLQIKAKEWTTKTYQDEQFYYMTMESIQAGIKAGFSVNGVADLVNNVKNLKLFKNNSFLGYANDAMKLYSFYKGLASLGAVTKGVWLEANYFKQTVTQTELKSHENVINAGSIKAEIDKKAHLEGINIVCEGDFDMKVEELIIEAGKNETRMTSECINVSLTIPIAGNTPLSAGFGMQNSQTNTKSYSKNFIKVKGKLRLQVQQSCQIIGVTLEADEVKIQAKDLFLASLQDSIEQSMSGMGLSFSAQIDKSSSNANVSGSANLKSGNRSARITSQIASIIGRSSVNIAVRQALKITGGLIANAKADENGILTDEGVLNINCAQLILEKLGDYDNGRCIAGGLGLSSDTGVVENLSFSYSNSSSSSDIIPTIGKGTIEGPSLTFEELNRDIEKIRQNIKSSKTEIEVNLPFNNLRKDLNDFIQKGKVDLNDWLNCVKSLPSKIINSFKEYISCISEGLQKVGVDTTEIKKKIIGFLFEVQTLLIPEKKRIFNEIKEQIHEWHENAEDEKVKVQDKKQEPQKSQKKSQNPSKNKPKSNRHQVDEQQVVHCMLSGLSVDQAEQLLKEIKDFKRKQKSESVYGIQDLSQYVDKIKPTNGSVQTEPKDGPSQQKTTKTTNNQSNTTKKQPNAKNEPSKKSMTSKLADMLIKGKQSFIQLKQNYPRLAKFIIGIIEWLPAAIKTVSYVSAAFTGGISGVVAKIVVDQGIERLINLGRGSKGGTITAEYVEEQLGKFWKNQDKDLTEIQVQHLKGFSMLVLSIGLDVVQYKTMGKMTKFLQAKSLDWLQKNTHLPNKLQQKIVKHAVNNLFNAQFNPENKIFEMTNFAKRGDRYLEKTYNALDVIDKKLHVGQEYFARLSESNFAQGLVKWQSKLKLPAWGFVLQTTGKRIFKID